MPDSNVFDLTAGMTVDVESQVFPLVKVDVDGPVSPLWKIVKPKITIRRNGDVLYSVSPHGEPDTRFAYFGAFLVALGLVYVIWLIARR